LKVLQINTTINTGSTGRIAEEIGKLVLAKGNSSFIAFGRKENPSKSVKIEIGNKKDFFLHTLKTRLFDKHGFGSKKATGKFLKEIAEIQPDVIHLHNVHGYYVNLQALFSFLKEFNKPIVWTLHDCWAFTGHCAHFEDISCTKWETHCNSCPKVKRYPASWGFDNSFNNFAEKKKLFSACDLHIVVPSKWLNDLVSKSFLSDFNISVIYNGVDVDTFKPATQNKFPEFYELVEGKKIILGVANVWQKNKGLNDFIELSKILSDDFKIVLIGLTPSQIKELPNRMLGIGRTESVTELANWYAISSVFVNPTWSDNFPTTNLEALACGTPVITYRTGGSPEAISAETGFVVDKGDINGIWDAIKEIERRERGSYKNACRKRAEELFNKEDRFQEYLDLYEKLLMRNGAE
jgi:putative colanic acid biosynthesis glycosyltransferase